MSSMRNAVSRRPHKERSQPKAREKWGILEKHKDYALRARDYNLKKSKLAALTSKARNKNEDEFAFGMLSAAKSKAGKHGRRDEQANQLSHDAVKLLKSQDAGYLRVVAGRGRKELEKLEQLVGMDGGSEKGTKVVFVPDEEEESRAGKRRSLDIEMAVYGEMDNVGSVSRAENIAPKMISAGDANNTKVSATNADATRSKKALAAERNALQDLRAVRKRRKRLAESRVTKLEALKKRQKEIMAAADELELQRAKMTRTVGGVNKDGVKWKIRERRK